MLCGIPSVLLAASFQLRLLHRCHKFIALQFFITSLWAYKFLCEYMIFLKTHPQRKVFHTVYLNNLENVFQRNLRTGRTRGWILRASGGTSFTCSVLTMVVPLSVRCWFVGQPKKLLFVTDNNAVTGSEIYLGIPRRHTIWNLTESWLASIFLL